MVARQAVTFGLLAVVLGGCGNGDGLQRVKITGRVTYQGEPVADGSVLFIPCDGTTGPSMITRITDGTYCADSQGGAPVGNYQVRIFGYRAKPGGTQRSKASDLGPADPARHPAAPQQYLPEIYNLKTQLKLNVRTGARSMTRDFTLAE